MPEKPGVIGRLQRRFLELGVVGWEALLGFGGAFGGMGGKHVSERALSLTLLLNITAT